MRGGSALGLVLAAAVGTLPTAGSVVSAVSAPSAPVVDGTIKIISDNDYALFAGDSTNVTRIIHQNNDVFWDQVAGAASKRITLSADETYVYLLGMGGGGVEDIGGTLNDVDVTLVASGPNGVQRATGRAGGQTSNGYLLLNPGLTNWAALSNGNCDSATSVCWGPYVAQLSEVQAGLVGATWGNPPNAGHGQAGNAWAYPDSTAVMFRFKATALGAGIPVIDGLSATVSWRAPASDGGSAILDYTATAYRASDNSNSGRSCTTADGSTRTCEITGLTGGVSYYFRVTARNSAGPGAESNATGTVLAGDVTPPTLSLAATASQSSNNVSFTLTGNEAINCSTVSTVSGVDFTVTGGTLASVSAAGANACTIIVTSGVAAGSSGSVTLTRAASFSVADTSGNAQTAVSGSPVTVTVTIPAATTTTTSTTVAPSPTTTAAPALEIVVNAPTTTVATLSPAVGSVAPGPSAPASSIPTVVSSVPRSAAAPTTVAPAVTTTLPNNAGGTVAPRVPRIEVVPPGDAAVSVDGERTDATIARADNQVTVTAGPLSATFGSVDSEGNVASLDADGNVVLRPGDVVRIRLAGFEPGSEVEAWLFSTPVLMGRAEVERDGTVTGNFAVPEDAPSGAHRIAVVARTNDGKPTTLTVGVLVGDWEKEGSITVWLIVLPIVLAVASALMLPATRRRRRAA